MIKKAVVFILLLIILVVTPAMGKDVVNSDVYTALDNSQNDAAYVIVILRPTILQSDTLTQTQQAVAQVQNSVLQNLAPDDFTPVYQYKTFPAMTGYVNTEGLVTLAADPNVERVGLDMQGQGHLNDSVPFIGADTAHSMSITGEGITVAVLDTGIDVTHVDLLDNIAPGAWHFLDQGADIGPGALDGNGQ